MQIYFANALMYKHAHTYTHIWIYIILYLAFSLHSLIYIVQTLASCVIICIFLIILIYLFSENVIHVDDVFWTYPLLSPSFHFISEPTFPTSWTHPYYFFIYFLNQLISISSILSAWVYDYLLYHGNIPHVTPLKKADSFWTNNHQLPKVPQTEVWLLELFY